MGCNCRNGVRKPSPRAFVEPRVVSPPLRSACTQVESEGNGLTVRVSPEGRLFLGEMPATSVLGGASCRGSFAQAVLAANLKLTSVYLSPAAKARFVAQLPSPNIKLGFLRDILRTF